MSLFRSVIIQYVKCEIDDREMVRLSKNLACRVRLEAAARKFKCSHDPARRRGAAAAKAKEKLLSRRGPVLSEAHQ